MFYAILFALGAGLAERPVMAADDLYTIRGIQVDVTAEDAAKAREKAFSQAQVKAFRALAEQLMPETEIDTLVLPDARDISTFIMDFEITQEQLSRVRYIATYTFRFRNDDVRNYLSGQGLSFADIQSKPVLILPFYQPGAYQILWHNDNDWLKAWQQYRHVRGLVPVVIPIGDIRDITDIPDDRAMTYDPAALADMIDRYGAGEALIVIAEPHGSPPQEPDSLDITLYRTDLGTPQYITRFNVARAEQQEDETLFAAAIRTTHRHLQQAWRQQTTVAAGQETSLQANIVFADMNEWMAIQRELRDISIIRNVRIISLRPGEARVEIQYRGDESRLRLALSQADFTLRGGQRPGAGGYGNPYGAGYVAPAATAGDIVYELQKNRPLPWERMTHDDG